MTRKTGTSTLIFLLHLTGLQAQIFEAPPPQIDHEREANYRDSVYLHQNTDLHYRPHRCMNHYGKYGWVDKYHKVVIPFEYDLFPVQLSDFNLVQKGRKYGALDAKGRLILPFQYSGITPLFKQERVICSNGAYKKSVFDFKGRVIIREDSLRNLWLFNDTTLALQFFKTNETKLYNLQGKYFKTWTYKYINELPSGRFKVSKDTVIGINALTLSGLIDASGMELIPMHYTSIQWEQGDWARVLNYKTKTRGLYQISTQTLHPDTHYSIAPPDPFGNFTFWVGESSEYTKAGLMDADFNVIYPSAYRNIRFLDEKGHYMLMAGSGLRGPRYGVGNKKGEIVADTVLSYFKQLLFDKTDHTLSRAGYVEYDTLPFWSYENAATDKKGLWHQQLGQLRAPEYDRIAAVSHSAYVTLKKDTSLLFHADGRILAGPYYSIHPLSNSRRYLLAQSFTVNSKGSNSVLLDIAGQHVKDLENDPRHLADGVYFIRRFVEQGYKNVKQYALLDQDLNPVTDFVFELEPWPIDLLNLEQRIRILEMEQPAGFGKWIGFLKTDDNKTLMLLDAGGQIFELK